MDVSVCPEMPLKVDRIEKAMSFRAGEGDISLTGTTGKVDVPSSEEFTRTLGQLTWLLTQAKDFKSMPVSEIEPRFVAPLMLKQVRIFTKGKAPIAALSWAYASPEVQTKIAGKDKPLLLNEWRSGPKVTVVDIVSPFTDPGIFTADFLKSVSEAQERAGTT